MQAIERQREWKTTQPDSPAATSTTDPGEGHREVVEAQVEVDRLVLAERAATDALANRRDEARQGFAKIIGSSANRSILRLAWCHHPSETRLRAEPLMHRVLALCAAGDDARVQAVTLHDLGNAALRRRQPDEAEKCWAKASGTAPSSERKLGNLERQASLFDSLAGIATLPRERNKAEKRHHRSLKIYRKLGHLDGQARVLDVLGLRAFMRGELDESETLLREAAEINRTLGLLDRQGLNLERLGNVASKRGHLDEAEKPHREALALSRATVDRRLETMHLCSLAKVAETGEDWAEAEKIYREVLAICRVNGSRMGHAMALNAVGRFAKMRGDFVEARQLYSESRDMFASAGRSDIAQMLQGALDQMPVQ